MDTPKRLLVAALLLAIPAVAVQAHEAGTWVLRAGVGTVDPKSDNLSLTDNGDQLTVEVDSGTSLTLMGTYMFTQNWGLDILAAYPFKHDVDLTVTSGGTSATAPIAEVEHLPPTVSIQYHFLPDGQFQPYVGLGANWTTFTSSDVTSEAQSIGLVDLDLDDSFGLAAQVGADWVLGDTWLISFDVRWLDIDSDATATLDDGVTVETDEIGTVEIDPLVYSINVGFRF